MALRFTGLPLPALQHPVGPCALDLAGPAIGIAVEYDGRDHLDPDRALRDLEREAHLTVVRRPDLVAERVRTRLLAAAGAANLPLDSLAVA